ncbi:MAG: hypothetical protein RMY34_35230 [Aulosira sp. DedQUE10]|nr:hypothetical protein [Aulosira sp. DedQUE10]
MTQSQNSQLAQSDLRQYLPSDGLDTPALNLSSEKPSPKREPIKHILIGSPKAVTSTIHRLHVNGYANVGDWSPLLPTLNQGEVMSILVRQILVL